MDECAVDGKNPCQNGGKCTNLAGGFNCTCPSEARGKLCEELNLSSVSSTGFNITFKEIIGIVGEWTLQAPLQVLALGEESAVQAVVGSIVWAFRRLKNPKRKEMSARGYAFHSICPQLPFLPNKSLTIFSLRRFP